MATFQARVEDLVGAVSDTARLAEFLNQGAKVLIQSMPDEILEENSTELTVSSSGLALGNFRIHSCHKNGYGARKAPSSMRSMVQDSGSIHYALPTDPVMVVYNSRVYVYPSGGTALVLAYPSVAVTDTSISTLQTKLHQIIVYYAAIQMAITQIGEAFEGITTLEATFPTVPTAISAPSFTYTDINTSSISVAISPPTFGTTELTTALAEYDTAFDSIDTPLDTEEDIELATSHMQRVQTRAEQVKLELENAQGIFGEELEAFRQGIQIATKNAEIDLQEAIKNQDAELQSQIAEYQSTLSKFQADVAKYVSEINSIAMQIKTKIDKATGKAALLQQLREEYKTLMQVHLGVN